MKKIIIGIAVLVVAVILSLLIMQNINPKIPLAVGNIKMSQIEYEEVTDSYFSLHLTVSLNQSLEIKTLYNCHIEVKYLTLNDTWKTTSENIGIVNYGDYKTICFTLDYDFKSGNPYLKPDGYYHGDVEPNIRIEAYGYEKQ